MDPAGIAALIQRMLPPMAAGGGRNTPAMDWRNLLEPIPMSSGPPPMQPPIITPTTPPISEVMRPAANAPYYLARPEAAPSYGGGLYGMPGSPNDDSAARVTALINSMEPYPAPTPPQHRGFGNKILGALGDALANYGSVRAGGPAQPMGQYGAGLQGERLRFQGASDEAAKNNAAIRNQMRLAAFQKEQDRQTAKEVARIRALTPNRSQRVMVSNQTIDIKGVPTSVDFIRDPMSGDVTDIQIGGQSVVDNDALMTEIEGGIKGFAPVYMNQMGPDASGNMTAGLYRFDRGTGRFGRVGNLQPIPQEGFVKDVGAGEGVMTGMPGVMKAYNEAVDETTENASSWTPEFINKVKNYANATVANTSMKDLFSTPKMINYYDQARGILSPYIRYVSGLTVPEAEYKRYERRLPIPGVTAPQNVVGRWNSLVREILRDMESKYRVSGRTPPQRLTDLLRQIDQQLPTEQMLGLDANGNPIAGGEAPGELDEAEFFRQLDERRKAGANAAPR